MYHLVLLFAATALLCEGKNLGQGVTVNRHMDLLTKMDKQVKPNAVPTRVTLKNKIESLMKQPPAITTKEVGPTLEISCEAFATPAPSIRWFRNDEPVHQHDSNWLTDMNPSSAGRITSTLLVSSAAAPARYTCLIDAGSKSTRKSSIDVNSTRTTEFSERSKLVPLAPRILASYKVFIDGIGTSVIVPCRIRGHPRPHVVWFNRDNNRVDTDPRMKVLRSGELVISVLRWDDIGDYTCQATNIFGTASVRTFIYPAQPSN